MKLRRLVNFHLTGRYAGIYHLHGVEQGPTPLTNDEMPVMVEVMMLDGRYSPCELFRTTETAVIYREAQ